MSWLRWAGIGLLTALCGLAVPALGATGTAGTIDSLAGTVTIARSGGKPVGAHAGDALREGDTLSTGRDSWALLDMVDGATFTLRPQTRLRFDAYSYSESSVSDNKSFLSLLTGTFRAVTGAIGMINRAGYKVVTPSATVGIRGTDHETAYYPPGATDPGVEPGTYDKVNQGETFIRSAQGEIRVRAGQAGFAHHRADRKPRVLASIPAFYARHAALDRKLTSRLREIRQRHEQKLRQLRTAPRAGTSPARPAEAAENFQARQRQRAAARHAEGRDAAPSGDREARRQRSKERRLGQGAENHETEGRRHRRQREE